MVVLHKLAREIFAQGLSNFCAAHDLSIVPSELDPHIVGLAASSNRPDSLALACHGMVMDSRNGAVLAWPVSEPAHPDPGPFDWSRAVAEYAPGGDIVTLYNRRGRGWCVSDSYGSPDSTFADQFWEAWKANDYPRPRKFNGMCLTFALSGHSLALVSARALGPYLPATDHRWVAGRFGLQCLELASEPGARGLELSDLLTLATESGRAVVAHDRAFRRLRVEPVVAAEADTPPGPGAIPKSWTMTEAGHYRRGPYAVDKAEDAWEASGPGYSPSLHATLKEAKAAIEAFVDTLANA